MRHDTVRLINLDHVTAHQTFHVVAHHTVNHRAGGLCRSTQWQQCHRKNNYQSIVLHIFTVYLWINAPSIKCTTANEEV